MQRSEALPTTTRPQPLAIFVTLGGVTHYLAESCPRRCLFGPHRTRRKTEETESVKTDAPQSQERQDTTTPQNPLGNLSDADRKFLLRVVDFVHDNMKARKITVDLVAEEMCMSRSQFTRRITALTNDTPNAFLTRIRMEKAMRLLKDSNKLVKEIAYECGFDESNYFIRVFQQMYGMTPQQYRNTPAV